MVVLKAVRGDLLRKTLTWPGVNGWLDRARECLYWGCMTGTLRITYLHVKPVENTSETRPRKHSRVLGFGR